jgi:hypothetical protein
MIQIDNKQKEITKKLLSGEIKSVNDFIIKSFSHEFLKYPLDNKFRDLQAVAIYSDFDKHAYDKAKTFHFFIKDLVEIGFISTMPDSELPTLRPYIDVDEQVFKK